MSRLLEHLREALAPKYTVERTIASGGMGVVFLGHNTRLQSQVAIKVLKPELATADMEASFGREARLLAKLKHPNIVTIHDVDVADGIFYYVMEFIDGETVADRIKRWNFDPTTVGACPIDPDETLRLGQDLLSALETVHKVSVVHRDIKPANIFLVEGRGILVDFGIAHDDTTESTATLTGMIKGTPAYMPPERLAGIPATPRTDLYALSMVLYECATGEKWDQSIDSDDGNWASVPHPLARALRKALKHHPADRWPDAAGFLNALAREKWHGRILIAITAGIVALIGVILWFVLGPPAP